MKKLLSLLLAVMIVVSLLPTSALADEVNPIELQQVESQGEQQEEPLPEPVEEQSTEEQPQQSGMDTLDLIGEAAPLAEGSANGGYYTESGAVIAFDENGISGCNYTVDETPHTVSTDTFATVA